VQTPEHATSALGHRQRPVVQTLPPEHVRPQPPQFVELDWRSTHSAPHNERFPSQPMVHTPAEQTSFARQALPHPPQFAASLVVSVH
jgi:hypothetical protein